MSYSEQPIQAIQSERISQAASRGFASRSAETTAPSPFRNPLQESPSLATSRSDSVQLSSDALRNLEDGIDNPCGTKPHQPFPWPPVPHPPQPPVGNAMPHPPFPRPPIGNPVQQPSLGGIPGSTFAGLAGANGILPLLPDPGALGRNIPGLSGGTTPTDDFCGTHPRPHPHPLSLGVNPALISSSLPAVQAPALRAL